jgi:diguanylate cyclase (GGDEF)-like protein
MSLADDVHHFTGANTRYLVRYVRRKLGDDGVAALLADAGERRSVDELVNSSTWSTYWQFRTLLEAAGRLLGDRAVLAEAGAHADLLMPFVTHAIMQLGSVEALFEHIHEVNAMMTQLVDVKSDEVGPYEWILEQRFRPGYEPFVEYCRFCLGVWSVGPAVFGFLPAQVEEVECSCDGATACRFRIRVVEHEDREASSWKMRARVAEIQRSQFEQVVHDLVSGIDLDALLDRATQAAAEAVGATASLLELHALPSASERLYSHGLTPDVIQGAIREAADGAPGPSHLAVPVASNRRSYGYLTAVRPSGDFLPQQRVTLGTYARFVALALDSATTLQESRDNASRSEALLDLASALADMTTREEMAERLVRAVPAVIDCDRAVVTLVDPDKGAERFVATYGMPDDVGRRLSDLELPVSAQASLATVHIDPGDPDLTHNARASLAVTGSAWSVAVPIVIESELAGHIVASVVRDPERLRSPRLEPRLRGLAAQASTAIRNATLLDQVRHQAFHDALTGLANRALIVDRLEHMVLRARRDNQPPGVLFIDLDGFKEVNDTFGHVAGDSLIRQAAQRIAACARASDTVGRMGGDEFVVLLEGGLPVDGVERIAERFLAVLNEPYDLSPDVDRRIRVTASIGASLGDRASAAELLRDADVALYRAKQEGKGRCVVFAPEVQRAVHNSLALRSDLYAALEENQFFLEYQPVVDLSTGAVTGAEALLRWRRPDRGVLTPDTFIPILEETGMIADVGRWVLHEACHEASRWIGDRGPLTIAVNVSPSQLGSARFLDDVRDAVASSGLDPSLLVLEVTENVLMRDTPSTLGRLEELKRLGVRIAIDDVGAGYSSLADLRQIPVDQLKIDRAFVAALDEGAGTSSLVHALVQLGKSLGLQTVAEGVERPVEHRMLCDEACDAAQGYLFAPPLDAAEFRSRYLPSAAL